MQEHKETDAVEVTLLIAGGHRHTIRLAEGSPLLTALVGSIVNGSRVNGDRAVFNIPLGDQKGSLLVSTDQICGLLTDRPLTLEAQPPEQATRSASRIKGVKWWIAENFLKPADVEQLLQFAVASESRFVSSRTSSGDPDDRKSLFLPTFDHPQKSIIDAKVMELAAEVSEELLGRRWRPSSVTSQLTVHGNGDYFRKHQDKFDDVHRERVITFVYYFFHQPKRFEGGELLLFDSINDVLGDRSGPVALEFRPPVNSLILFPSEAYHEVVQVHSPSQAFLDSRFTVNGWLSE